MKNNFPNLDYIINVNNFQKIQDAISKVAGTSLLTVDYKGTPVTKHSNCSDFCKLIRTNCNYSKLCEKCDSRGGLEAARLQHPYVYICHMGLIVFAIPIIVDNQYLGALVGGQILIKGNYEKNELECISEDMFAKARLFNKKKIEESYKKIKTFSLDKIKSIANMIFLISNYIVEEALLKIKLNEMNEEILRTSKNKNVEETLLKMKLNEMSEIISMTGRNKNMKDINIMREKESDRVYNLIDAHNKEIYNNTFEVKEQRNNIILKPALEYIKNNCCHSISLDEMASLCNISSSYFSKLFKKVTGENFSNYINKLRMKKAKELLESSDISIKNLSIDLGFEDCGYFVKVFKKIVGVTPSSYRLQHKFKHNEVQ
ncbi:MAG: helix-turn-helix domain-containing protein [Clostridiales bacterium]|nr:helix-turn-helix domain-containing protein [Clostridiales bacterium]